MKVTHLLINNFRGIKTASIIFGVHPANAYLDNLPDEPEKFTRFNCRYQNRQSTLHLMEVADVAHSHCTKRLPLADFQIHFYKNR